MYILMYVCYADKPVVGITTVSVGCEYVNISWSTTGNNDECSVGFYSVTLSYVAEDIKSVVHMTTKMNSSTITGLPDDTHVNITVTGVHGNRDILSFDSTSLRTIDIKSMCKFIILIKAYAHNVSMYAYVHSYITLLNL